MVTIASLVTLFFGAVAEVPLSFFENLANLNSGARRLDDLDLDSNYVALHENYSNVTRGKQVWLLPKQNFTEERVVLEEVFADELSREIFERAMEARVHREPRYEIPSALADLELPQVVGYFAPTSPGRAGASAVTRELQTVEESVDNMTNSSNETEVVYLCAPDITTVELTPWTKSMPAPKANGKIHN
eukprot:s1122_g5.t1